MRPIKRDIARLIMRDIAHAIPPAITSSATFNAAENQTSVGTVRSAGTAPIVYSISGGADAALFNIDSVTGVLTFADAPDFEIPSDDDGDNVYNLTVTATGPGGSADQNIAVTVTDVLDPPAGFAAHYKFNDGITVTGAGVSQWDDQSGNGHHLLQATDARRPTKNADGSILFNGTSHFLATGSWVLAQPFSIYALMKQVTWTANDIIFGNGATGVDQLALRQVGTTPQLAVFAGSANSTLNGTLALDTYAGLATVFNGASSRIHVNGQTATGTAADIGSKGLVVFALGAETFPTKWSNIEVKEILIYAAAHDATQRQAVFDYLVTVDA